MRKIYQNTKTKLLNVLTVEKNSSLQQGNKFSMLKKVSIMNLKDVNHVVKKENKKKKRISNYIEMKISFFRGII